MDIFTWLRRDHTEILALLGEGTDGVRARAVGRWEIHARIEENFLFPLLRSESDLRHPLADAVETHERIREGMRGYPRTAGYPAEWGASGLPATLERLQDMKERRIFPRARESLSADDSEELVLEVLDFLRGLDSALAAGRRPGPGFP